MQTGWVTPIHRMKKQRQMEFVHAGQGSSDQQSETLTFLLKIASHTASQVPLSSCHFWGRESLRISILFFFQAELFPHWNLHHS